MMFLELNDTERDRITGWNGTRLDRIKYSDGWSMKKSDALEYHILLQASIETVTHIQMIVTPNTH